ncbi:methyltransferase domain containing protein [Perkinsela sp. CCAP 1560/4]|nr:methyltransferase domain containing protein [Perkinsela sp. CCAP 1560/4]|eukprot:KNH07338.1 methyltransferase domain containing protein [Perkinsela sp. CCAP 1560/4]
MGSLPRGKIGHKEIYKRFPDRYDAFMSAHDYGEKVKSVILPMLKQSNIVIDAGCGTGRISRLVAPLVQRVYAFDQSPAMVTYLASCRLPNTVCATCALGDESIANFHPSAGANPSPVVIIAAWSLCCVKQSHWAEQAWKPVVSRIIDNWICRFQPERIIVLENLGTGVKEQTRKGDILQHVPGFSDPLHIRTDYAYATEEEALRELTFFYGGKTAAHFVNTCSWRNGEGQVVIPEVTGVYVYEAPTGKSN